MTSDISHKYASYEKSRINNLRKILIDLKNENIPIKYTYFHFIDSEPERNNYYQSKYNVTIIKVDNNTFTIQNPNKRDYTTFGDYITFEIKTLIDIVFKVEGIELYFAEKSI